MSRQVWEAMEDIVDEARMTKKKKKNKRKRKHKKKERKSLES